jgi:hypothetical protein
VDRQAGTFDPEQHQDGEFSEATRRWFYEQLINVMENGQAPNKMVWGY